MITIHHLAVSQSERIVWLCEELQIPYKLDRYERDPATGLAPASFKGLHPLGTAPVITDDGLVLAESGAIIDYVVNNYANGRLTAQPGCANYADYLFWFHFANGSMMPNLGISMVAAVLGAEKENPIVQSFAERNGNAFALIEKRLGEVPYFAGREFTAADIIMFFPLTTMRNFVPADFSSYPNLQAYLKRIGNRPAYIQAMAKSDPSLILKLE